MIGIGLGGFVDGLEAGSRIRERRETRSRDKVLQEREDTEYKRAVKQRDDISAINTQAQTEFQSRVDSGAAKPDQFDTFWNDYALPKLKNTYLAQGNMEMAEKVQQWGDTADARAGAKLAMSAITKAQTGDAAGALADAMEAGKRKGYISHGFEILGQDTIVDPSGQLQGYRLKMKGPDGNELTQDLPLNQVPKLIATYLNPETAWQSQIAAQQEEAKRNTDLQTYRDKKGIDQEFSTSGDKSRGDAITALRKRMDGGLAGDEQKFDDLEREDQEKLIAQEIELQSGQPGLGASPSAPATSGSSGRKVLVDTATGQPVAPERSQPAPQQQISGQARDERAPESRQDRMQFLLSSVEPALKEGVPAERVADELRQNGVPEEAWPESLRRALVQRQKSAIGLGG